MSFDFKRNILLTGAGFTKNFGGFLAREMWSKIFNHPDLEQLPRIKNLLRINFDFETIYSEVMQSAEYSPEEKQLFHKIIKKGYDDMDTMVKNYNFTGSDPYEVNLYGVGELLGLFVGSNAKREVGCHFTLNQDLFLERKFQRQPLGLATLRYKSYLDQIQTGQIDISKPVQLPDKTFIDDYEKTQLGSSGDIFYIKLHGSCGWQSFDGKDQMVLGTSKEEDMKKEPILNWYLSFFERAIYRSNVRLLIIGYGFNDAHINRRLSDAIKKYGLKLYVISSEDQEILHDRIIGKPKSDGVAWVPNEIGQTIWNAVESYFPNRLKEIFPKDQSRTTLRDDLLRLFPRD